MSTESSLVDGKRSKTPDRITKNCVITMGPLPFEQPDIAIRDTDAWKAVKDLIRFYMIDSNGDEPNVRVDSLSGVRFEPWAFVSLKREENAQRVCDAIDGNTWYGRSMNAWWGFYSSSTSSEQHEPYPQEHHIQINPQGYRRRTNPQPLREVSPARMKQIQYCPTRIQHSPRVERFTAFQVNGETPGLLNMPRTPYFQMSFSPWYTYQAVPSQQNVGCYTFPDPFATAHGSMLPVSQYPFPPWPTHQPVMVMPGYPPVVAATPYSELSQAYHTHHVDYTTIHANTNIGTMTYPVQNMGNSIFAPPTTLHTTQPPSNLPSTRIEESDAPRGRHGYESPVIIDGTVKRSTSEQAQNTEVRKVVKQ